MVCIFPLSESLHKKRKNYNTKRIALRPSGQGLQALRPLPPGQSTHARAHQAVAHRSRPQARAPSTGPPGQGSRLPGQGLGARFRWPGVPGQHLKGRSLNQMDGRTDGQRDGRMYRRTEYPLYSTGHRLSGAAALLTIGKSGGKKSRARVLLTIY